MLRIMKLQIYLACRARAVERNDAYVQKTEVASTFRHLNLQRQP